MRDNVVMGMILTLSVQDIHFFLRIYIWLNNLKNMGAKKSKAARDAKGFDHPGMGDMARDSLVKQTNKKF